jgi:tRNA(Arg) A34 adenosine deaminase TadA
MNDKAIVCMIAIMLTVIGVIIYVLFSKGKESRKSSRDNYIDTIQGAKYDNSSIKDIVPALQYNIVNNPIRNNILRDAQHGNTPEAPKQKDIDDFRQKMNNWYEKALKENKLRPMDKWCKISIDAALDSIAMGNWGIGNVLCYMPKGTENNPEKWVEILRGGNRFFTSNSKDILSTKNAKPRFNSHGHGEMIVLDAFEEKLSKGCYDKTSPNYEFHKNNPVNFTQINPELGYGMPDGIVLFTQLNSCQMCLSRIGNSGLSRCYWIAPDNAGGAAHRLCDAVPAYFNMLNRQLHTVADASPEMIQFAFEAFAGPENKWVTYCTWKLGMLGSPENMSADYKYCIGQYYANDLKGQNAKYDWEGFFRTIDSEGGPQLSCTVTPP